ncbi:Protein DedD [Sphingobium sp. Ant17]|nr:Protein DedD [Sphingobium sp. Ant17]
MRWPADCSGPQVSWRRRARSTWAAAARSSPSRLPRRRPSRLRPPAVARRVGRRASCAKR